MAIHSSILAWRIPWTEEPGGLHSIGIAESDTTERLALSLVQLWPAGGWRPSKQWLGIQVLTKSGIAVPLSPGGISPGKWGQQRRQSARPHPVPPHGALDSKNVPGEASAAASSAGPPLAFAATLPSRMAPGAKASQVLRRSAASSSKVWRRKLGTVSKQRSGGGT